MIIAKEYVKKMQNVKIIVNSFVEALGVVFILSDFKLNQPRKNEKYINEVKNHFSIFKNHKIVNDFRKLLKTDAFKYDAPITMAAPIIAQMRLCPIFDSYLRYKTPNPKKNNPIVSRKPPWGIDMRIFSIHIAEPINIANKHMITGIKVVRLWSMRNLLSSLYSTKNIILATNNALKNQNAPARNSS